MVKGQTRRHAAAVLLAHSGSLWSGWLAAGTVAWFAGVGAWSALACALAVLSVPYLVISLLSLAIPPALAVTPGETAQARGHHLPWHSIRAILPFGLAATVSLWLWAEPLVRVLFEAGIFGHAAVNSTVSTLRVLVLGITPAAVSTALVSAFREQRWQSGRLLWEGGALVLLCTAAWILGQSWGTTGIAVAVLGHLLALNVVGLLYLRRRLPVFRWRNQVRHLTGLAVAGLLTSGLMWPAAAALGNLHTWSFIVRLSCLIAGLFATALLFLTLCFFSALPELDSLVSLLLKRRSHRARILDPDSLCRLPARIRTRFLRTLAGWQPLPRPTTPERIARLLQHDATPEAVACDFRTTPIPPGLFAAAVPKRSAAPLEAARSAALRREVDLLGSGPVALGRPINWHKDYVSGYVWPRVHHARIRAFDLHRGVDCRFPWELARCQHWAHLAARGPERPVAVKEMIAQFHEFVVANPPGTGINFASTMEVAARATNWICAFRSAADLLADRDLAHLLVEMETAGSFIHQNLDAAPRGLNGHHYITSLLGLYVIGTYFSSLPDAAEWHRLSGDELSVELPYQFDESGAPREGSPAYARFVIESYLFAYLLGKAARDPRVTTWRKTLEQAFGYLAALVYPDGRLPQIGDDDAGRLLVPPGEAPDDCRYLIQIGAAVFDRSDWKERAGCEARPGLEFWLGPGGVNRFEALLPPRTSYGTQVFEAPGIVVRRTTDSILVIHGGRPDTRMPRAHLHNDLTSLEFVADGVRWILDPGTFQCSRQPTWRNRFRSTFVHNVVLIDQTEQNRYTPDGLFYLAADARPMPVQYIRGEIVVGYRAAEGAPYESATRRVECSADGRTMCVYDHIEGRGHHTLTLGLNVARRPFTYLRRDLMHFRDRRGDLLLYVPAANGFITKIRDGWCSPRFGVRERCFRVEATGLLELPVELVWQFAAVPHGESIEGWSPQQGLGAQWPERSLVSA